MNVEVHTKPVFLLLHFTLNILHSTFCIFYLLRIATTGSIFAAIDAGIMPASTPTMIQMLTASIQNIGRKTTANPKDGFGGQGKEEHNGQTH